MTVNQQAWRQVRCGDIIDVRDGTHDTPPKSAGGYPLITSKNLVNGSLDFSDVTYISEHSFREIEKRSRVDDGDIVMAMIGTIGSPVLVKKDREFAIKNVALFKLPPEEVNGAYFLHLLNSEVAASQLERNSRGGNQKFVSLKVLRDLQIPLPPLSEQKRIAEILDRAESLRRQRRAALALLDELTQSIFLDMFGDPVSNSMDWPLQTFQDLGTLDRGISKNRPRNSPNLLGGVHPLIQTGDIASSGGYIRKFVSTYSDEGLKQSRKWPAGTLCITIAANIAKTGVLTFDACFPDSVVGFKSDHATVEYTRVWLSFLQKMLEDAAPESAQKNINLATLRRLPVPVPPLTKRSAFASRISAVEFLKAVARRGLEELDQLFASLQHRAFRGEL